MALTCGMTPDAAPEGSPVRTRLAALLVAAVLLVFGLGLPGRFVWDDHGLIVSNAYLRDLANLPALLRADFWHISAAGETAESLSRLYWRPVVTLAYALEFQLFGLSPLGYHAVNLALHLASTLLVFGLLRRRVGAGAGERGDVAAGLGALVFAVHPSRPESVAWISGATDLWMTLFALLAERAFASDRDRRGVGAGLLVGLGILSKEAAVVVPALLTLETLAARDDARRPKLAGLWAVVAAVLALRFTVIPPRRLADGITAPAETVARALASLGHYVGATLWPWRPTAQLGFRAWDAAGHPVFPAWSVALGAATVAGFVALAAGAWRRPSLRPWLFDACRYLAPLALVVNVVDLRLDVLAAERFLYLPLVGVAAAVARGLVAAGEQRAPRLALGALCAAMAVTSMGHVGDFITEEDLWLHERAVNPNNPYVCGELARLRLEEGRANEAIALYAEGVRAARVVHHRRHDGELVMKLAAAVMLATPDDDQATLVRMRDFFDAVDRGDPAPVRFEARGLRVALKWNDAERADRRRLFPYRIVRAIAHARTLSLAEAERQLRDVLTESPDAWLAWQNLSLVYAASDRWGDAVAAADEAARRDPANAGARALRDRLAALRAQVDAAANNPAARDVAAVRALLELRLTVAARRRLDAAVAARGRSDALDALRAQIDAAGRPPVR
ncbi:MAG: glycosyltransferase family 39 protein [Polyangiales bacterium]